MCIWSLYGAAVSPSIAAPGGEISQVYNGPLVTIATKKHTHKVIECTICFTFPTGKKPKEG